MAANVGVTQQRSPVSVLYHHAAALLQLVFFRYEIV